MTDEKTNGFILGYLISTFVSIVVIIFVHFVVNI